MNGRAVDSGVQEIVIWYILGLVHSIILQYRVPYASALSGGRKGNAELQVLVLPLSIQVRLESVISIPFPFR